MNHTVRLLSGCHQTSNPKVMVIDLLGPSLEESACGDSASFVRLIFEHSWGCWMFFVPTAPLDRVPEVQNRFVLLVESSSCGEHVVSSCFLTLQPKHDTSKMNMLPSLFSPLFWAPRREVWGRLMGLRQRPPLLGQLRRLCSS